MYLLVEYVLFVRWRVVVVLRRWLGCCEVKFFNFLFVEVVV